MNRAADSSGDRRPNVVIVYADQMRADAMGCAGHPLVETPHLDRLGRDGVRFSNAFVSYPWCTPFRASLFTGNYAQGHGLHQNHFPIDTDQAFLAQTMADAGYRTGYIGKWHLAGGPKPGFVPPGEQRLGFDHFVGFNRGHNYLDAIYFKDDPQPYHCPRYEPEFQTDQLIDFIESAVAAPDGRPFFGFVCFGPPHHPMTIPDDVLATYDPADVPLPVTAGDVELQVRVQADRFVHDWAGIDKARAQSKARPGKEPGEPESESEVRGFVAGYLGMITHIDACVGRMLARLDDLGVADDTIVVFLSDHGDMLGQHGHFCGHKLTAYKAAAQVPFLVRYPARVGGGRIVDDLVDIAVDTFPTLLELCGIDVPDGHHGQSYTALLDGEPGVTRDAVMYQTMKQVDGAKGEFIPVPERGMRTSDWLYVRQPSRPKLLIDLRNDPDELRDLATDPGYASIRQELDELVLDHMAATDDDWELHCAWPPPDFMTHAEAKRHVDEVLMPNAIIEP